jgi:hypothetical protein
MKSRFFLLISVATAIGFSSCQKEISSQPNPTTDPGSGTTVDSTILWKYIELDTTHPAGSDTATIYTYKYDSQKRLEAVTVRDSSYYGGYIYDTVKYYYTGADTLSYKITRMEVEPYASYTDTGFYSYSNGIVVYDSTYTTQYFPLTDTLEGGVTQYTISGNNVLISGRHFQASPLPAGFSNGTIFKTYMNGNIVTQTDTTTSHNLTDYPDVQLNYDNHPNPFYKIDLHYPIYDDGLFSRSAQKNNFIEEIGGASASNLFNHIKYSYTYRPDGYPVKVRKIDMLFPTDSRVGIFIYKN